MRTSQEENAHLAVPDEKFMSNPFLKPHGSSLIQNPPAWFLRYTHVCAARQIFSRAAAGNLNTEIFTSGAAHACLSKRPASGHVPAHGLTGI